MNLESTQAAMEALQHEPTFKRNAKNGIQQQYGIKLGDLRKLAKKIKTNHSLALELWNTENFDSRMLAVLIMDIEQVTAEQLDVLVRSMHNDREADWLNSYIVKLHPEREALRQHWIDDPNPMAQRSAWNIAYLCVGKNLEGIDLTELVDRIERDMPGADPLVQWMMNFTLAEIGIAHESHRARALDIGERIGLYRDYKVPKGCTSPFAPAWINEMVGRMAS